MTYLGIYGIFSNEKGMFMLFSEEGIHMAKKLVDCPVCGEKIAKNANVCPHCGANLVFRKPGVWIGLILWCVALFCLMKACSVITKPSDYNQSKPNPPSSGSYVGSGGNESTSLGADRLIFGPGTYVVGEDLEAGKYDCLAVSGFGVLRGDVASMGPAGFVQTMGGVSASAGGETASVQGTTSYSNLTLADGDILYIEMSLNVEFVLK